MIGGIFAGLILHYEKRWMKEKEDSDWRKWEEGEEMRQRMGHYTNVEKIPKSLKRPRRKHRH